jgi:hypothetical protein
MGGGQEQKVSIKVQVTQDLAWRLQVEAQRRGMRREDLISDIIAIVSSDDLYGAVLDR